MKEFVKKQKPNQILLSHCHIQHIGNTFLPAFTLLFRWATFSAVC